MLGLGFDFPQALLLLLPLGLLLWRTGRVGGPAMWLRAGLVGSLTVALAGPVMRWHSAGADLVVVVDRSRSMPPGAEARAQELIALLEPQRRPGDRLGVLAFGREVRLEMPLSAQASFGGFHAALDNEASDLAAALDAASEQIPTDRAGRVLVISDGRATGLDARAAARRLAARGIAVDYRHLARDDAGLDVAVTALQGPAAVAAREPFVLTASVRATRATSVQVTLSRQGHPLVKTTRQVLAGDTTMTFSDLVESPGLQSYQVSVEADGDTVVENDLGRAVVRVEGPPKVVLLTDHPTGTLAQTLRAGGVELAVQAPGALSMGQFDGVGAVVLEDVEAGRLTEPGLKVLAQFVREAGGGLVMTGGKHSFGEGGYRKSAVEELLPVSLEIREEQRKAAVAISIIMDCSCSMGATVPDGRTKMELAAEGVVGALQLLNERDEASVHMVDTGPHTIFSMSPVSEGLPLGKVARGFSGGGGIYIGEGLRTGKKEILKSHKPTRHVLLFADAADSEEPDDFRDTLQTLKAQGVTVSVIGMGSASDSDAELLREVAALGQGRIYFAEDVTSLPRIFSQETIAVARSSFVDSVTALSLGADLSLLGKIPVSPLPQAGGYNLTYLKPQASVALRTEDDNHAPAFAFWPRGAGRVAAMMLEVDGQYTGAFRQWGGRRALLEEAVRWVMPPQAGPLDAIARSAVQGNDLHVTLDFDATQAPPAAAPTLVVLSADARLKPLELPMQWEDEDRAGAHYTLPGTGTWHPVVKLGERVFRAPPVTLSYAPEFEPGLAGDGRALLMALATLTGGVERLAMAGLFVDSQQSAAAVPIAPALVALALAMLVAEVVVRRFFAGRVRRARPRAVTVVSAAAPNTPGAPRSTVPAPAPRPSAPGVPTPVAPPAPAPSSSAPDVGSALEQARARASKRTGR